MHHRNINRQKRAKYMMIVGFFKCFIFEMILQNINSKHSDV